MSAAKADDIRRKLAADAAFYKLAGNRLGGKTQPRAESGKFAEVDRANPILGSNGDKKKGPQADDVLAEMFDSSHGYINDAKNVLSKAPDLAELVGQGKMTIPAEVDREVQKVAPLGENKKRKHQHNY